MCSEHWLSQCHTELLGFFCELLGFRRTGAEDRRLEGKHRQDQAAVWWSLVSIHWILIFDLFFLFCCAGAAQETWLVGA